MVSRFKENTMLLYNAIMEEKRILFVGESVSAAEVCTTVLSTALLICPPFKDILKKRVFPCASVAQFNSEVVVVYVVINVINSRS